MLSPMLMGFIFYDNSPRNAMALDPDVVKELPEYIRPVGVFVNESTENIEKICKKYGICIVQLHGDESPEQCRVLMENGYRVIKAVKIKRIKDFEWLMDYEYAGTTMFLFDTPSLVYGGSGKKFDWRLLKDYPLQTPYLLSGGIGEDDTDAIIANMGEYMVGIDINSRFETAPGEKDIIKLTHFINSLRKLNEYEPTGVPFWKKN